jgi:hypothetical protein
MAAYRTRDKQEPSESDRETSALHDLLARMKRLRRRTALPTLVASLVAVSIGTWAHALGYWSVLGTLSDGSYFVGTATFLIAAIVSSAPVLGPGIAIYLFARARLRRAWQEEHRQNGVSNEWLAKNVRRFG